jgi:hypothetical protein
VNNSGPRGSCLFKLTTHVPLRLRPMEPKYINAANDSDGQCWRSGRLQRRAVPRLGKIVQQKMPRAASSPQAGRGQELPAQRKLSLTTSVPRTKCSETLSATTSSTGLQLPQHQEHLLPQVFTLLLMPLSQGRCNCPYACHSQPLACLQQNIMKQYNYKDKYPTQQVTIQAQ